MIGIEFDATGFVEARRSVHRLGAVLDDVIERAVRATAREVAKEAKSSHGYRDRTGRLTRSITHYEPVGEFSDGSLEGIVGATMPYASFVEDGTSRSRASRYLGTAWLLQRDETDRRMEDALESAVQRAGLGP